MDGTWQDLAALGLVGVALIYLARLARRRLFSRSSAGGCGTGACGACPSGSGAATGPAPAEIVTIGGVIGRARPTGEPPR